MKIAFWSNTRKSSCVTTNLTCISALTAIAGVGKTVLLENHYNLNSIGDLILEQEKLNHLREHGEYYSRYGIEYILKRLYSGESGEKLIHQAAIPLLYSQMLYVPQGRIVNKDVFNYEFHLVQRELFRSLDLLSDYIFIDTESNQNLSTATILAEADLVVVNLDQNPVHLQEYFENYASLHEKAVYLIGGYCAKKAWNQRKICYEYHIPREKIGCIPYNLDLADAMMDGHLLQFLNRNYAKPIGEDNKYFMQNLKKASEMIRKNMLAVKRKKRITIPDEIVHGSD